MPPGNKRTKFIERDLQILVEGLHQKNSKSLLNLGKEEAVSLVYRLNESNSSIWHGKRAALYKSIPCPVGILSLATPEDVSKNGAKGKHY